MITIELDIIPERRLSDSLRMGEKRVSGETVYDQSNGHLLSNSWKLSEC